MEARSHALAVEKNCNGKDIQIRPRNTYASTFHATAFTKQLTQVTRHANLYICLHMLDSKTEATFFCSSFLSWRGKISGFTGHLLFLRSEMALAFFSSSAASIASFSSNSKFITSIRPVSSRCWRYRHSALKARSTAS